MMQSLTGWSGGRVLYFGDHPYSDLADVTLGIFQGGERL